MKNFIIVKSYTTSPLLPDRKGVVWEMITGDPTDAVYASPTGSRQPAHVRELDEDRALALIEEYGLVPQEFNVSQSCEMDSDLGTVYDTPDQDFGRKWMPTIAKYQADLDKARDDARRQVQVNREADARRRERSFPRMIERLHALHVGESITERIADALAIELNKAMLERGMVFSLAREKSMKTFTRIS